MSLNAKVFQRKPRGPTPAFGSAFLATCRRSLRSGSSLPPSARVSADQCPPALRVFSQHLRKGGRDVGRHVIKALVYSQPAADEDLVEELQAVREFGLLMPPTGQAALGLNVLMGTVPAESMAYSGLACRMATPNLSPLRMPAPTTCPSSLLFRHPPDGEGPALDLRATHARTL